MEKQKIWRLVRIILKAGGWFPLLVFISHLLLKYVLSVYAFWPRTDMFLHFFGGLSIATFVSDIYQLLTRGREKRGRAVLLEMVLMVSLTAVAAVFWEFGEFASDQLLGTFFQGSLLDTMQDLILGMSGALLMVVVRAWQLNAGVKALKELMSEMSG